MSTAERAFRLLLRAYPPGFRAAYGREMALVFRDRLREPGAKGLRFWAETVWDVARSAPALRLEEARGRGPLDIPTGEGTMKTMAILAVLIGGFETLNSLVAGAGGIGSGDGYSLLGGVLGVAAGALLLGSGVALLRHSPGATALARGAAFTCLAVFVLSGLVVPRMSILATALGIGFPLALLLFLRRTPPGVPVG